MLKKMLPLAAACMAFGAAPASALVSLWPYPNTLFEDTAVDWYTNDIGGDRILQVGDVLTAIVEVDNLDNAAGPGPQIQISSLGVELTGVAIIQVKDVTPIAGTTSRVAFGAAPVNLWPASLQALATSYPGVVLALWEDPSPDLNLGNCASFNACLTAATDGTLWQVDGIPTVGQVGYDVDNEWFFIGSANTNGVENENSSVTLGNANYAMSNLYQLGNEVYPINAKSCLVGFNTCPGTGPGDGMTDVIGSSDIKGGAGLTNGGFARGNFAFDKIPEPATLALFGLGALGLGGIRRRNRKM